MSPKLKKKVTLEDVAELIKVGNQQVTENLTIRLTAVIHEENEHSFNGLGRMIKEGFDQVDQRFDVVERRLTNLEIGQEDIMLRLDSKAPTSEVRELDRRVTRIEKKVGIKK